MNIAIIDADLIGRQKHRFPNLASEKISAYHKDKGDSVVLKLDYDDLASFDRVYISKVFTDTPVPEWIDSISKSGSQYKNIYIGGTGFFFDSAPRLPDEIEHHCPDYHLYDNWVETEVKRGKETYERQGRTFNEKSYRGRYKFYTDYSIGFMTRGCFRKCPFCVNQNYDSVRLHSHLLEFFDPRRKKICLLDDNVLGSPRWQDIFNDLNSTGRPFTFRQGMDERLLTDHKCEMLFNAKYDGTYTFAFDNIADFELIEKKLELIRKHTDSANIRFYVLCGFDSTDGTDIANTFKRIALLQEYSCLPYIMRYQSRDKKPWKDSEFSGMYLALSWWCNQPHFFKTTSFREFCQADQKRLKTNKLCSSMRAMQYFESRHPDVAREYFDRKYNKRGKKE